ncbi:MAG TPA: hypothetical protein VJ972_08400, partial [Anaerolineales bacterium]|nr:hypothetical protein [Anaerolineales bacterium]
MKKQSHILITVFIVLFLGLSSCTISNTPLVPTQTASPPTDTPTKLPPSPVPTPTLPAVCQSLESQETPSDLSGEEVVSKM